MNSRTVADSVREGAEAAPDTADRHCNVVELRQYTLHPQRFAAFVELFEREFIEPQEAAGMTVIGQFRDLADDDRFVWLRGFADMPARGRGLEAFYGGNLWKSLRAEANASFINTDDVLLLRPPSPRGRFDLHGLQRLPAGMAARPAGLVVACVYPLATTAGDFPGWFERSMLPVLARAGITPAAWFETEPTPNNFPRLPVREGEQVFVWLAHCADRDSGDAALRNAMASAAWRATIAPELERSVLAAEQLLWLEPTPRSLLRA